MSAAGDMMVGMEISALRAERLRSHRLTAPAPTPADAARHLLAVQAQEFWAGRWALAARSAGAPTLRQIDRLFDRGVLVRAWTQRGTLHVVPAEDLGWMLQVTGERQLKAAAPRYRELGLGAEEHARVERAVMSALAGGNELTRAELFALVDSAGIDPAGQRGVHAVQHLALRGLICQGPVVHREGAVAREQRFVRVDEWTASGASPADPAAEMFARYAIGHGPVTAEDFAWWAGVTLAVARAAAAAGAGDERLRKVEEGRFIGAPRPRRRSATASVHALGSFEEFYISYQDRSPVGSDEVRRRIGPGKNGMVRPVIVRDGEIVGAWAQSTAVGRHADDPTVEMFDDVDADAVRAALARYAAFVTG